MSDLIPIIDYLARWGHFLFGVAWIGLLYYFNFVQGGYMAAATDEARVDAFTKLVPKALWWFRWGAMGTFLTGLVLLYYVMIRGALTNDILLGFTMGTLMFLNVWLVIWPNQKVVIASNESVRDGGEADPNQGASAAKALLASRTNTLFSGPMLFFMGSGTHFPGFSGMLMPHTSMAAMVAGLVIIAILEANALFGKTGPITTVKGVITSSIVLTIILVGIARLL